MGFLLYSIWTHWRFRLILSGLQRVHGNTNETRLAAWPVSTDGSHHRSPSYDVGEVHLGARLDRAPTPGRILKASGMDEVVSSYRNQTLLYYIFMLYFNAQLNYFILNSHQFSFLLHSRLSYYVPFSP